ncbi:excalibur calcium-binding domain-containing protein [Phytohabitans rumicis]|uniref:Excalibur calcium-binding domain-containing protein n=1 Tax=Phytohabitans rumicis TaxID=1076125 RepID=A0A6V8L699_9ACTN|nr:excalibur calcium-binding domain-containing protein [Phytohabitans rumicis]GFJ91140.1 hypothetical protein Prum_047820 [Phytohabitans rumicis]
MTYRPLDESWRERRAVIYGRANQASSHYGQRKQAKPMQEPVAMTGKMSNRRRFWLFAIALLLALAFGTAMFGVVFAGPAPVAEAPKPPARERTEPVQPAAPPLTSAQGTPVTKKKPATDGGDPAPRTTPAAPPSEAVTTVSYKNCGQARKAGAAPLYASDPGYAPALDKDGDGVACETGKP